MSPWTLGGRHMCEDPDLTAVLLCPTQPHSTKQYVGSCVCCAPTRGLLLSESCRSAYGDAAPRVGVGATGALTTYLLHLELLSEMPSPAIIYFLSSPTAYHVALG